MSELEHDEPTEKQIRDGEDALTEEIEAWADRTAEYEAEVSRRMKHIVAALHVAAVPLDCTTGQALRNVGDAMQALIHEAIDE